MGFPGANTFNRFYLSKILDMIGITDAHVKSMINLGNTGWSFVNGTIIALIVPRFKRRTMFLVGATGMLLVYVAWTVPMAIVMDSLKQGKENNAAGIAVIFFIFFYSPWYNVGNNALAYSKSSSHSSFCTKSNYKCQAYLVELFPYAKRSRGISVEQFFVRGAGFFTTFVNPIGMDRAGWKYLIMYICMILVEILTIYFFYPETQGRTLEELAFRKSKPCI